MEDTIREDAERYRWLCENACDLIFWASGSPISGKVEIDPDQYPVKVYGSAKPELDALIDAKRLRFSYKP